MIILDIPLDPVNWVSHAGRGKRSYSPKRKEILNYEISIASQYKGPVLEGYFSVDYLYIFSVPLSFSKKDRIRALEGTLRPIRIDLDNADKFLSDRISKIVWKDDRYVIRKRVEKLYGEMPQTIVKIRHLPME